MPNSLLPRTLLLVDQQRGLCEAWERCFGEYEEVEVHHGDFFERPADAMVSPANSFGIMDGGLDLAIRDQLGFEVQRAAQEVIRERHHGELAVGCAEIVATPDPRWPNLVIAPTMRVPELITRTLNPYLAFRAALLAVMRFNENAVDEKRIDSVVIPGLGTGIGGMGDQRCAVQMRMAYRQLRGPARVPSYREIHKIHAALTTS